MLLVFPSSLVVRQAVVNMKSEFIQMHSHSWSCGQSSAASCLLPSYVVFMGYKAAHYLPTVPIPTYSKLFPSLQPHYFFSLDT